MLKGKFFSSFFITMNFLQSLNILSSYCLISADRKLYLHGKTPIYMYMCVYIYLFWYIYIYTYICIHIYIFATRYAQLSIFIYINIHAYSVYIIKFTLQERIIKTTKNSQENESLDLPTYVSWDSFEQIDFSTENLVGMHGVSLLRKGITPLEKSPKDSTTNGK